MVKLSILMMKNELEQIKEMDFVRWELNDSSISFLLIKDEHKHTHEEEEEECCCHINGHLFKYHFFNISDIKIEGEECDNYKTIDLKCTSDSLSIFMHGYNYIEENSDVSISFNFQNYTIEDLGDIKEADV